MKIATFPINGYGKRPIPSLMLVEVQPRWVTVLEKTGLGVLMVCAVCGTLYAGSMLVSNNVLQDEISALRLKNEQFARTHIVGTADITKVQFLEKEVEQLRQKLESEEDRFKKTIEAEVKRKKELVILYEKAQQICTPTQRSRVVTEGKKEF